MKNLIKSKTLFFALSYSAIVSGIPVHASESSAATFGCATIVGKLKLIPNVAQLTPHDRAKVLFDFFVDQRLSVLPAEQRLQMQTLLKEGIIHGSTSSQYVATTGKIQISEEISGPLLRNTAYYYFTVLREFSMAVSLDSQNKGLERSQGWLINQLNATVSATEFLRAIPEQDKTELLAIVSSAENGLSLSTKHRIKVHVEDSKKAEKVVHILQEDLENEKIRKSASQPGRWKPDPEINLRRAAERGTPASTAEKVMIGFILGAFGASAVCFVFFTDYIEGWGYVRGRDLICQITPI